MSRLKKGSADWRLLDQILPPRSNQRPRTASHSHAPRQMGWAARGYAEACAVIRDTRVIRLAG